MDYKLTDISLRKHSATTSISLGILVMVALFSTVIFYPKLVIFHTSFHLGGIASENIKAPQNFFIEDKEATLEKKQQASDAVLTVYDYDSTLPATLAKRVDQAFAIPRAVLKADAQAEAKIPASQMPSVQSSPIQPLDVHQQVMDLKPEFEKMLGIPVSDGAYTLLENEKFSPKISDLIIKMLKEILENGVVANKDLLMQESDKGIVVKTIGTSKEQVVKNLKHFYGLDQAKTMVRIIGDPMLKGMDYNLINLIVDFAQRLLQPNITLNRSETEKRKKAAASDIKPILYQIKKGEMIIREGQRISKLDMLKLKALQEQTGKGQMLEKAFGTSMIIFALLLITYLIHLKFRPEIRQNLNKNLLFIAAVLVVFFLISQMSVSLAETLGENMPLSIRAQSMFYGIPLAAGAMTICEFMGFSVAFPFAIVLALMAGILFENSYTYCLYFLLNSIMGAFWIQNARHRKDFTSTGLKLGLFNILLATIMDIYMADLTVVKLLWDWAFAAIGGISAGIVTIGITPMVEMIFGYTTDSTLLELSNLDQPLMRRLMLEAPGTYHHSVIVGSLAEAAASEIGANPLLGKVCGYYHDIGKLKNPLHFIENQRDGKNIHNKLAPSMSCLILTSHIKNGVELAREKKLGQNIIDAIKQHHGTSLISFFYEKAKKVKKDQPVNIDNFRYPGPKPQTKETALVMLADVVEAAARSMENPSSSRIQGLVQQLINKVFSDNQLDECPLTLKDLHNIARSFNKILNGIYHHRIEYPDKPFPGTAKEKNGSTDNKSPETAPNLNGSDAENSSSPLKRLGQS